MSSLNSKAYHTYPISPKRWFGISGLWLQRVQI